MLRLAVGWRDGSRPALTPETEMYVRGFGREVDHGVIATTARTRLGAAWWRVLRAHDGGYGYVRDDVPEVSLAVSPPHRRRGIATRLLERLLADAAARGIPGLSLSVEPDNPARLMYERLGFVRVGELGGAWTMLRSMPR
ncbi:MAG: GNAT family N-acetyltransferase [Actinobacteria bacterium]|nr:GNAT family N-acetyltransferase [Actinomycetota bacterium]